MDFREAMARRYCIIRQEDPDEDFGGRPIWRDALVDIESVLMTLDSFGLADPTAGIFNTKQENPQLSMDFEQPQLRVIRG